MAWRGVVWNGRLRLWWQQANDIIVHSARALSLLSAQYPLRQAASVADMMQRCLGIGLRARLRLRRPERQGVVWVQQAGSLVQVVSSMSQATGSRTELTISKPLSLKHGVAVRVRLVGPLHTTQGLRVPKGEQ